MTLNKFFLILLFGLFLMSVTWAQNPQMKTKEKIPGLIGVGFGVGEYEVYNAYEKNILGVINLGIHT